ncbi:scavenger receptor cysteine-rich domain-containing protein DMBT1-like [Narcine bancroftii]|uniref:scavenger receptor cysteine-rich domain-containing protein DMBT1-like n=1 Tax=Narcine bancroftii TaxID=1343680 RepID=UPI00383207A7
MYNCGGSSSGCSCDFRCHYYGNCCSDFCDYCPHIDNEFCGNGPTGVGTISSRTTSSGSCRHNCAGFSFDCNCDYSCRYYGNCCADFCDYCAYMDNEYCDSYTTESPTFTPTESNSCRYKCGGHSSACSCDHNCYYYGNCCFDFCDHCAYINNGYCGGYGTSAPVSGGSCGGLLGGASGSVVSPGYPDNYTDNAACIWYIRVNGSKIIDLWFIAFDLEESSGCSYDYVAIYDGPSTSSSLIAKLCHDSNETFTSTSNSMTIYFRSDSSVTRRGFVANYRSIYDNNGGSCGGFLGGASGSVVSPGYPDNYPDNAACIWYIRVNGSKIIDLRFIAFDLEESSSCSYDYVAIYDGPSTSSSLMAKLCHDSNETFTSTSNSMTIYFRSDSSVTRRGFVANYRSIYDNNGGSCGGFLGGASGSVVSPGYPDNYPDNAACIWYIRVNGSKMIDLRFIAFDLEESSSCSYDYVAIYDGPSTNSSLMAKLCHDSNETFTSTSNSITIYFRSDSSVTRRGFVANYRSVYDNNGGSCGGFLGDTSGSFVSPGYPDNYPDNAACIWYIRVNGSKIIDLQFIDFVLEESSSCSFDYVAIYDGPSTSSSLMAKLCHDSNETFTSSSNSMTVYFRSDSSVIRRGFTAIYRTVPINNGVSCGGYLSDAYGSVFSPGFPNSHPNNAECIWYIRANTSQVIKVRFTDLDLEVTSGCSIDYIALYDGPTIHSDLLAKLCHEPNETFTSSSNSMTIYFRSDSNVTRRGFTANYHFRPMNDDMLNCSSNYLEAKIDKSYLNFLGMNESRIHLNDRNCRPIITAHEVNFKIPFTRCGTIRQVNNGHIVYSNTILSSFTGSIAVRTQYQRINIACKMQQDTMVKAMYSVNENSPEKLLDSITQSGTFRASMMFYESTSFVKPVSESPYYVDLQQKLFVQVKLNSSGADLKIFVDTCTAVPDNFNLTSTTYDLIKNGCVRDETYDTLPSPSNNIARFTFSAFKFLNVNPSVYLRCKLVLCEVFDYSSRCYRGCMSRHKRATVYSNGIVDFTLGPIKLKKY